MANFLEKILRSGEGRILRQLNSITKQVNALEDLFEGYSDEDLRELTPQFRARLEDGASLDSLLPEAFAAVREAAKRTLEQRHYDVQIMGGAALHRGNIAEMKTGEGKTLVATLAAYLNALEGKGVHVVTVNDYLARYQSELMGRVFRFLGMTTGCILTGQTPAQRREQYAMDITYGTNNEFGFDYLRDNMTWRIEDLVQRGHHFAIIDEVDSILIDEARTPLIISGPASGDANRWYTEFAKLARKMQAEVHYEVDETKRTVGILEEGIEFVEDQLGIDNLYESLNTPLIGYLNNSIKVKELFRRDKDYVVQGGEVKIVDEHTGRLMEGRRYNDGLHQAIEAKEGVTIKAENQTLATVTLQNYFRMYDKLSGMTGTAETEAAEFMSTYELGVVPIPTNEPIQRIDQSDFIYKNIAGKFDAVAADIIERHAKGQPILVGTASVETSEMLSAVLKKRGVPHEVLNAKQHTREAHIVAQAGRKGAVTVATNMAGRGTDIMLGGNAEVNAVAEMARRGLDPVETPEEYEAKWGEVLAEQKLLSKEEHDEVVALGGLYVLGTERHDARRIDNQLRGRSGRQGDPGESRFYLSLEDDLMRRFASGVAGRIMEGSGFPDDIPLESKMVSRSIASAQAQVEARNFEARKNILKYDEVMNAQRKVIYGQRRRVLEGEDLQEQIAGFRQQVISDIVLLATQGKDASEWDLDHLFQNLRTIYPVSITPEEVIEQVGSVDALTPDVLVTEVLSDAELAYQKREEELTPELMRQLERRVVLSVLDRKWRDHLYEMDYLKEGIGLRAMAQRNPLIEYEREGFQLFEAMTEAIKEDSVRYMYNLEVRVEQPGEQAAEQAPQGEAPAATTAAPVADAPSAPAQAAPRLVAGGLDGPAEQVPLTFSSSNETAEETASGGRRVRSTPAAAGAGNREARRRAAKSARKKN